MEMLEHVGCRVTAVENGAQALAAVADRALRRDPDGLPDAGHGRTHGGERVARPGTRGSAAAGVHHRADCGCTAENRDGASTRHGRDRGKTDLAGAPARSGAAGGATCPGVGRLISPRRCAGSPRADPATTSSPTSVPINDCAIGEIQLIDPCAGIGLVLSDQREARSSPSGVAQGRGRRIALSGVKSSGSTTRALALRCCQ